MRFKIKWPLISRKRYEKELQYLQNQIQNSKRYQEIMVNNHENQLIEEKNKTSSILEAHAKVRPVMKSGQNVCQIVTELDGNWLMEMARYPVESSKSSFWKAMTERTSYEVSRQMLSIDMGTFIHTARMNELEGRNRSFMPFSASINDFN